MVAKRLIKYHIKYIISIQTKTNKDSTTKLELNFLFLPPVHTA